MNALREKQRMVAAPVAERARGEAARASVQGDAVSSAARKLATAGGHEFEREIERMLDALRHPDIRARHDASLLLGLEPRLGAHLAEASGSVLSNEIAWSGEEQAYSAWAARVHGRWAEVSAEYAKLEIAAMGRESPLAPRLLAMALASHGSAIKWSAIAGRGGHGLSRLHEMYLLAEGEALAGVRANVLVDGIAVTTTAEALYVRALLLDALCAGSLSRQETDIADNWFLRWGGDLCIESSPPRRLPEIVIDTAGPSGLALGTGPAGPAARYLAGLDTWNERVREVRAGFLAGRVPPGAGGESPWPVERHVSALDRLDRLLGYWTNAAATRELRARVDGSESVPCLVGLGEIVGRGFGPLIEEESDPPTPEADDPARDPGGRGERQMSYGMSVAPIGRRAVVVDRSPKGLGLSIPRSDHGNPSSGDLVGTRLGSELLVGHVVRSAADPLAGRLRLGVRLLVESPVRIDLVATAPGIPPSVRKVVALFVPGPDSCGRYDAMLVSRAVFQAAGPYELALGERVFTIRFNRDQTAGRGWVAACFEVLSARNAARA